jgi:hypothetical protein
MLPPIRVLNNRTFKFHIFKKGHAMTMTSECDTKFPRTLKDITRRLELKGEVEFRIFLP